MAFVQVANLEASTVGSLLRVRAWARERGLAIRFVAPEGSGSCKTLYVSTCKTTVNDRKIEIDKRLLAKMLGGLGIARDDLEAAKRRKCL